MAKLARKAVIRKLILTGIIALLGSLLIVLYSFTNERIYLYSGIILMLVSPIVSYVIIVWWFYRITSKLGINEHEKSN